MCAFRRDTGSMKLQGKKKLQYFLDYYFLKVFAAVCAAAVVFLFLFHYFRPQPETKLYAAVYDRILDTETKAALAEELAGAAGDGVTSRQVIIDGSFRSDSAKDVERIQVLAANHALDVILCSEEAIMREYAAYGYFEDLSGILSEEMMERAEAEERLVMAPGMLWSDEISFEDTESGQGPECPYFLDISGKLWDELTGGEGEEGYLGVVLDAPDPDMASEMVRLLLP